MQEARGVERCSASGITPPLNTTSPLHAATRHTPGGVRRARAQTLPAERSWSERGRRLPAMIQRGGRTEILNVPPAIAVAPGPGSRSNRLRPASTRGRREHHGPRTESLRRAMLVSQDEWAVGWLSMTRWRSDLGNHSTAQVARIHDAPASGVFSLSVPLLDSVGTSGH